MAQQEPLSIVVSKAQLALLRKLHFPCSETLLASARPVEEGFELSGSRLDLDDLAGWVASEANHTRGARKVELLDDLLGELESALR